MIVDIARVLVQEEGQYFDRKSLWHGPAGAKAPRKRDEVRDQIAEYVAAFANAEGGTLLFGAEDDGAISSHGYPSQTIDTFLRVPADRLTPPQAVGQRVVHDGKEMLLFTVEAAPTAVMVTGSGFPYRAHDDVVMMREEEINAIKRRGLIESVEAQAVSDRTVNDLDLELVRHVAERAGLSSLAAEEYLIERRLADQRGPGLALRRAAVLLFAKKPSAIDHPHAGVRIFRVKGTERKTGREHNVEEVPRIEGNLPSVLERSHALLSTLIRKSAKLHDLFFREMPEYPTFAWQEAVVNAIAHRDYGVQTRSIEVWLFDDRMEVKSPGGLLPEVRLDALVTRTPMHASRNPRIARVLAELGVMREQGEGIPRMIEEMEYSWLPLPELKTDAHGFQVALRNTPIYEASDPVWVEQVRALAVSERQKRALIGHQDGEFTNQDYRTLNQVDRDEAYRELHELVVEGLLETSGKGQGARYSVRRDAVRARARAQEPPAISLQRRALAGVPITNTDYRDMFQVNRLEAKAALRKLCDDGRLVRVGRGRGAHYVAGPAWTQAPKNG